MIFPPIWLILFPMIKKKSFQRDQGDTHPGPMERGNLRKLLFTSELLKNLCNFLQGIFTIPEVLHDHDALL